MKFQSNGLLNEYIDSLETKEFESFQVDSNLFFLEKDYLLAIKFLENKQFEIAFDILNRLKNQDFTGHKELQAAVLTSYGKASLKCRNNEEGIAGLEKAIKISIAYDFKNVNLAACTILAKHYFEIKNWPKFYYYMKLNGEFIISYSEKVEYFMMLTRYFWGSGRLDLAKKYLKKVDSIIVCLKPELKLKYLLFKLKFFLANNEVVNSLRIINNFNILQPENEEWVFYQTLLNYKINGFHKLEAYAVKDKSLADKLEIFKMIASDDLSIKSSLVDKINVHSDAFFEMVDVFYFILYACTGIDGLKDSNIERDNWHYSFLSQFSE